MFTTVKSCREGAETQKVGQNMEVYYSEFAAQCEYGRLTCNRYNHSAICATTTGAVIST